MTQLNIPDTPKMIRETLCVAQSAVALSPYDQARKQSHIDRLARLINECDRHRPLGVDGKHGDLHTPTCGCEDNPYAADHRGHGTPCETDPLNGTCGRGAISAVPDEARCSSCEHYMEYHQADGCWFSVEYGRQDKAMGCACGVPVNREDK